MYHVFFRCSLQHYGGEDMETTEVSFVFYLIFIARAVCLKSHISLFLYYLITLYKYSNKSGINRFGNKQTDLWSLCNSTIQEYLSIIYYVQVLNGSWIALRFTIKFITSLSLSRDWLGELLLSSPTEYLECARLSRRRLGSAYLDESTV